MKKGYRNIIVALAGIITFSSCKKFLTTELTDAKQTTLSYYKKPSEAYTALVGCYNGLDQIYNNDQIPALLEVFSDNSFGGTGTFDGYGWAMVDEFDKSVSPSDISFHSGGWKAYYQTIYKCNILLQNMDKVAWGDSTALRTTYAAEAKFIRAYCYLDLVRLFENVPLVITPTLGTVPQADPEATFTQIMTDLREASDSLPAASYKSVPSGRITKWAAESLLARAYLFYSGLYGKSTIAGETAATALAAVEDVIAHSGHSLVSDFNTLWPAASTAKNVAYAGEDNPEVVFAIKYSSTDNWSADATGNRWMVMEGIRSQSIYPYQSGWGACTVDPKFYNLYPSTDTRRFATIMSVADEKLDYAKSSDCREYTGYFMKKYSMLCDKSGNSLVSNFQTGQSQDFFAIRYADVLLMAAELGSSNAVNYFNQVHHRADGSAAPAVAVSKADILAERRLEFAGEGLRYWDLLRQGVDAAAATIAANTTVSYFQDGTATPPSASKLKDNIKATRGFQQIPNDQITLASGTLKQNAGW
ncbi:MAG: RagB/SusD family nutrient uptake outer membrane protein [Niastella sp.]|uniref:RagB/SusD family nutrient uptake outer membrane protein n=1 Tax=Niastella sp. TaxID=1869183 RepID=UPI00389ADF1D